VGPLRGREVELAEIEALITGAGEGAGAVVLVEGAAGIGKSRLLVEACEVAASEGLLVARGSADELDQVTPWRPLLAALS
jgi:predicted ATPase